MGVGEESVPDSESLQVTRDGGNEVLAASGSVGERESVGVDGVGGLEDLWEPGSCQPSSKSMAPLLLPRQLPSTRCTASSTPHRRAQPLRAQAMTSPLRQLASFSLLCPTSAG